MCPFVENITDIQQEHDRRGSLKIALQHRHSNGCGIKHRDLYLSPEDGFQTFQKVFPGPQQCDTGTHRIRQEDTAQHPSDNTVCQSVRIMPVQFPAGVLRNECDGVFIIKREHRQCLCDRAFLPAVADDGITGAVKDFNICHTAHIPQIVFQDIRLRQAHPVHFEMNTYSVVAVM